MREFFPVRSCCTTSIDAFLVQSKVELGASVVIISVSSCLLQYSCLECARWYPRRSATSAPFIGIEEWILEQCHGAERSQGVVGKDLYSSSLDQEVKCR